MRTLPGVLLCGLVAAGASYWVWQTAATDGTVSTAAEHPHIVPAVPDPQIADLRSNNSASGQAAVDPQGCTILRQHSAFSAGTDAEMFSCERDTDTGAHPYQSYPNGALESLAYADATAAEILGMRFIESDPAASLSLVIHAAALAGGDPAPIVRYSNAYPRPVVIDDVPQQQAVRVKYVLAAVTALLGHESGAPAHWETVIRERSADPERELSQLQARAREIVAEMRRIEVEVAGSSTIGGQGDA